MVTTYRYFGAYLVSVGLLIAAPACASGGYYGAQRDSYRDFERRAYQNGFDEGVRHGERDARDRRDYRYSRDRDYRDADRGYSRGWGDRQGYRRFFRQGYQNGYTEGFNRVARAYAPIYPRTIAPRGGYASPAAQIGYRDGFDAGRHDARDRQRYDPIRPRRYRDGDRDYDTRYGSKDEYKREYRAAFQQGYEQGYREFGR